MHSASRPHPYMMINSQHNKMIAGGENAIYGDDIFAVKLRLAGYDWFNAKIHLKGQKKWIRQISLVIEIESLLLGFIFKGANNLMSFYKINLFKLKVGFFPFLQHEMKLHHRKRGFFKILFTIFYNGRNNIGGHSTL